MTAGAAPDTRTGLGLVGAGSTNSPESRPRSSFTAPAPRPA